MVIKNRLLTYIFKYELIKVISKYNNTNYYTIYKFIIIIIKVNKNMIPVELINQTLHFSLSLDYSYLSAYIKCNLKYNYI